MCHDSFTFDKIHLYVARAWAVADICVSTCLIHTCHHLFICVITSSCMFYDSFIVTWLIHVCLARERSQTPVSANASCICVMTYSYVWHDSFSFTCDMLRSYVARPWAVADTCVGTPLHHKCNHLFTCDLTRSCVMWLVHTRLAREQSQTPVLEHDSFISAMTHLCVTWPGHVWYDSFMCDSLVSGHRNLC